MAELALPIIVLGGLYVISNQKREGMANPPLKPSPAPVRDEPASIAPREKSAEHSVNAYAGSDTRSRFFDEVSSAPQGGHTLLTGDDITPENFRHKNMTPFFGSNVRGSGASLDATESLMDSMQGTGSQTRSKKETANFFNSARDMAHIHGMPNYNDVFADRFVPGTKMTSVNPFREAREEAPGAAMKDGIGGYNAAMQNRDAWMPKTIDSMRAGSNQKSHDFTMNRTGPINVPVKMPGGHARVEHHNPDTYYENTPSRWGGATTSAQAPKRDWAAVKAERLINKSFDHGTMVVQGSATTQSQLVEQNFRESTRNSLIAPNVNISQTQPNVLEHDYAKGSTFLRPTHRSRAEAPVQSGNITGVMRALVAPIVDVIKPTKKENIIVGHRSRMIPTARIESPAVRDVESVATVTNRQMFGERIGMNYLQVSQGQTHPAASNYNMSRTAPEHVERIGGASGAPSSGHADTSHLDVYALRKDSTAVLQRTTNGVSPMFEPSVSARNERMQTLPNERMGAPRGAPQTAGVEMYGQPVIKRNQLDTPQRNDTTHMDNLKDNPYVAGVSYNPGTLY